MGKVPKRKEEILYLLPVLGQTRGADFLNALLAFFDEKQTNKKKTSVGVLQVCARMVPQACEAKTRGWLVSRKKEKKRPTLSVFTPSNIRNQNAEIINFKT